ISPYVDEGLLGLKISQNGETKSLTNKEAKEWIEHKAIEHLKNLFPGLSVVNHYILEVKEIYDSCVFHGSANYLPSIVNTFLIPKMRSYQNKPCEVWDLEGEQLIKVLEDYYPALEFLTQLLKDPTRVSRGKTYLQSKILKTAQYVKLYSSSHGETKLFPGCNYYEGRLLREATLSQFKFRTFEQWQSWEREFKKLLDETGQTYEQFFLNKDGTLNYKKLSKTLDELIRKGYQRFSESKKASKNRNLHREYSLHPQAIVLSKVKDKLAQAQNHQVEDKDNYE
ncbi:MAG: hypothetical protein F6K23_40035, partial [Okeania sp. SIO2C9]|uniref:hypothetical protein n=1 Tax=Okeania sp. SIO2C9 TaxID=2607791 RepID=UPI0013BEC654